jgi:hypothetical protein
MGHTIPEASDQRLSRFWHFLDFVFLPKNVTNSIIKNTSSQLLYLTVPDDEQ